MSATILHVVIGSTGEYSDRSEWLVRAFRDEAAAREWAEKAATRAKEIEAVRGSRYDVDPDSNEFDPHMTMDYTGTSYYVQDVPLA